MDPLLRPLVALLRASEKYTKTDMVYLARGGFWLTLGQGFAAVSAFVLSIFFANYVSPETYGTYKYIISLAGLLAIPTLAGVHTALTRSVARGEEGAARAALKARLLGGAVAGLGSIAVSLWYFAHGNATFGSAFLIVAFAMPLMEAYGTYDAVLQGKSRFGASSVYFIISSLTATASLIVAILFFNASLLSLIIAYFGAWTVAHVLAWRVATRALRPSGAGDVVTYGMRLTGIGLVSAIAGQVDKIVMFQYLGPAQLAVYAFAIAMPEQLRSALRNLMPLALSRFAKRSANEIRSSIHAKALRVFAAAVIAVGAYIAAAPFLFQYLFPLYVEATFPSQIFALSLLFVPSYLYNAAFQSQRAEKLIAASEISLNILQIALLLILIPNFGIWGAIYSRLIGRYIGTAVVVTLARYL